MGYFHAPKRRRVTSLSVTAGIIVLIILVRLLPQPWRGMVDAGVVVGLAGITALVLAIQAFTVEEFGIHGGPGREMTGFRAARDKERYGMRRTAIIIFLLSLFLAASAYAGLLDKVRAYRDKERQSRNEPDTNTIVSGLKEALSIGARNGVKTVSQVNGYFGNPLIRIPMPEKIQRIEKALRKAGFNKEVDRFILSMNRAAEKAAPQALALFVDAVKEMTIPDAVSILRGNDTAATDYLKSKTFESDNHSSHLSSMNDVGVTRTRKMMDKTRRTFLKKESMDLDHYVTSKALGGLFTVVGQEEKKIKKDPAARVTELLKTVFK
jgi:hypothetical protein